MQIIPLILSMALLELALPARSAPGDTELVSVRLLGEAYGGGNQARLSGNALYAGFISPTADLVPGDKNARDDVFLRNLQSGEIERISVSSAEVEANGYSDELSISDDGRFVAFSSAASNLVGGDTNSYHDIFVRDRQAGQTQRISISNGGAQGDNFSWQPAISADGATWPFATARPLSYWVMSTGTPMSSCTTARVGSSSSRASIPPAFRPISFRRVVRVLHVGPCHRPLRIPAAECAGRR